jgi:hypothetical protein
MKKLLVLMLVASLTALANGMMLDISVGGFPTVPKGTLESPTDSGVILTEVPSQYIMLDIGSNGYIPGGADDLYWGLVVRDNYEGTITLDSGRCLMPPAPDLSSMLTAADNDEFFPGSGGTYGCVMSGAGVTAAAGIYFDEIIFHCDSPHDVVIELWSTLDYGTFILEDAVIIHQIPEPATIALLSLGGLLLRKRK